MTFKRAVDRPIILGIVGDSASGKTTIASGIVEILGDENVVTICCDDYHRLDRAARAEAGFSALDPRANYIDILEQHLRLLRFRKPILKPVYNHNTGKCDVPELIEPRPYVIVEGLLGYSTRVLRDVFDVKVYLEPEEELRIRWKLQRDCAMRGYTRDGVLAQLQRRKGDSANFVQPQRTFADIVVRFYPPAGRIDEVGAKLNVGTFCGRRCRILICLHY